VNDRQQAVHVLGNPREEKWTKVVGGRPRGGVSMKSVERNVIRGKRVPKNSIKPSN